MEWTPETSGRVGTNNLSTAPHGSVGVGDTKAVLFSPRKYRTTTLVCSGVVACIGLFGLAGWMAGVSLSIRLVCAVVFAGAVAAAVSYASRSISQAMNRLKSARRRTAQALRESEQQRKLAEETLQRTEEQLRQAQKMEAVGLLAGGIAHDFRNQLTVVKGFAELLLRRLQTDGQSRRPLEQILRAAERSSVLTAQLLAFGSRQVLYPEPVDLNRVIREMTASLRSLIGEDVQLTFVPASETAGVTLDPSQFEHAMVNLAINARDAMPEGGRLTIEVAPVSLTDAFARANVGATTGPHIMVSVRDTGVGMDEETLQRIFEPFFTTKPKGRGTGLGLATIYGFMKQSGGCISVNSKPQQGTTFRLYFPIARRASRLTPRNATIESPWQGTGTVLVVEDDDAIRDLLVETLGEWGYAVFSAANGQEAVGIAKQHGADIDLLMSDVVMPGMNGTELTRQVRLLHPGLPVLYLSGYVGEALAQRGIDTEKADLLPKPCKTESLIAAVRRALSQASVSCEAAGCSNPAGQ